MKGSLKKNSGSNGHGSGRANGGSAVGSTSFFETEDISKSFADRLDYLLVNGIGSTAIVTIPSGVKYEGILSACNPNSSAGIDVVLNNPKVVDKGLGSADIKSLSSKLEKSLVIKGDDVAELEIKEVDLHLDEKWEQTVSKDINLTKEVKKEAQKVPEPKKEFKTDLAISGAGKELKQKELKKWVPEGHDGTTFNGTSLEDDDGEWDQFAVNEKKFGIKPSFDEHFYTTRINKNVPDYESKLKEADRIAKDIESQGASGNVHVDEDRNIAHDDSGLDEEDKYSGVDRRGDELLAQLKMNSKPTTTKEVKYVPPSLRSQPHNMDPAILSTTGKTKKTSRAEIAEFKKFSEKFKVPYVMPEEVKTILKKEASPASENSEKTKSPAKEPVKTASATPAALKSNPSLPPKPAAQPPSTPNLTNPSSSKSSNRSSKSGTPSTVKVEIRRGPQNKHTSSGKTPLASPSMSRAEPFGRRRQRNFFDDTKPKCLKKDLKANFNMFLKSKEAHEKKEKSKKETDLEKFFIEKPYFTSPTWVSTVDQSYKTMFPDERTAIQRTQMRLQQRSINMMTQGMAAGSGGIPMGMPVAPPGGPAFIAGHPGAAAGSPGMFLPFQPQPMFYPPMGGQMMPMLNARSDERVGSGMNSQSSSPPATPAYGNGVPLPYGYPVRFQTMGALPQQHQQKNFHHYQHHNRNYRQQYESR